MLWLNLTDNGIQKFSARNFGRNQLLGEMILSIIIIFDVPTWPDLIVTVDMINKSTSWQ